MKITNKLNLPQPLVEAVTRDYQPKPKQYSVTTILKGVCQVMLERRHGEEIEQDVSDMIWALFGTAVHSVLENAKETDTQLKEEYLLIDIGDGYKLSGISDLYDEAEKKVIDYKTTSVWKVIYNNWDDYRKQLLMYAWMFRKLGFECDKGEIVAILKDHSKTKADTEASYPPYPVYRKVFCFKESEFEDIEKYIFTRFEELKKAELINDQDLEPCNEEERWAESDKYAIMKKGRKTALRVVESEKEAKEYMEWKGVTEKDHYIEIRKGKNKRCEDYCNVTKWCPFYQKMKGENENECA